MSLSKAVFLFSLSFIAGVMTASVIIPPRFIMWGFFVLILAVISVFWPRKSVIVFALCLLFLLLGAWRHAYIFSKAENSQIFGYVGIENITIKGYVVQEPDLRANSSRLVIKTKEIASGSDSPDLQEKILITTSRYPEYRYGDFLEIRGELELPRQIEDFNYKDYLLSQGILAVVSWPEIVILDSGHPFFISKEGAYRNILLAKDKLRNAIYQNLPSPQSSILSAMILGDRSGLSGPLRDGLIKSGLFHIIAISGMNITIISQMLLLLGLALGLWRGQAFYFALALLAVYIVLVGLPASGIRAGIMGGILLLAQKTGRPGDMTRSIVFAAAIMLAINPLLLARDVGFQLSFLAVLGMVYFGSYFKQIFSFIPEYRILPFRSILAVTLSAQTFTLPVLLYNFGQLSLISPLTNLLVLPIVPLLMLFGFVFAAAGAAMQFLGEALSWPLWLLLTYILKVVAFSESIPFAAFFVDDVHWIWPILTYIFLGFLAWRIKQGEKLQFLKY